MAREEHIAGSSDSGPQGGRGADEGKPTLIMNPIPATLFVPSQLAGIDAKLMAPLSRGDGVQFLSGQTYTVRKVTAVLEKTFDTWEQTRIEVQLSRFLETE
jgi:hypothetical protein